MHIKNLVTYKITFLALFSATTNAFLSSCGRLRYCPKRLHYPWQKKDFFMSLVTSGEALRTNPTLLIREQLKFLHEEDLEFEHVKRKLDALKSADFLKLWNSFPASFRRISVGELRMLTRGTIKEGSFDLKGDDNMLAINVGFYSTLISSMMLSLLSEIFIPDVDLPFLRESMFRYVACFSIGSLPFAFLGFGLSLPDLFQATLERTRSALSADYRERMARHEAGHLLVGYAMGLPVLSYRADPVRAAVNFAAPTPTPERLGTSHEEVDRLCAVSLAGVVAEAMRFGDGVGGVADLAQLQGWLSRAEPQLTDRQQQDRARWGCVAAYSILSLQRPALDALVPLLAARRPLSECLEAVEMAARS